MKIKKKTFSKIAIIGLLSICGLSLCIAGVATAQDNTVTIKENAQTTSVETSITSVSTTAPKKKTTTTTIVTTTNTTKITEKTTTGTTTVTTETTPAESLAREKGEIKEKTLEKKELEESTQSLDNEEDTTPAIEEDTEDTEDTEYYLEIETEPEPEIEEESTELTGLYGVMQGTYYEGTVGSYGYYVDLVGELQSGYSIAVNGIPGGTLVYINCPSCPSLNGYHQVADIGGMGYDTIDFFYFYGETPSDFALAGRVFDVYVYIC